MFPKMLQFDRVIVDWAVVVPTPVAFSAIVLLSLDQGVLPPLPFCQSADVRVVSKYAVAYAGGALLNVEALGASLKLAVVEGRGRPATVEFIWQPLEFGPSIIVSLTSTATALPLTLIAMSAPVNS